MIHINTPETVKNMPKVGGTRLCAVVCGGSLFVVDQFGEMIDGLTSCSLETRVDEKPIVSLKAYCHKLDSELDDE